MQSLIADSPLEDLEVLVESDDESPNVISSYTVEPLELFVSGEASTKIFIDETPNAHDHEFMINLSDLDSDLDENTDYVRV